MKKVIVMLMCLVILSLSVQTPGLCNTEHQQDNISEKAIEYLSRCDCLNFVMLAIGARSCSYPVKENKKIYEYEEVLGSERVKAAEDYYVNKCMFKYKRDLVHGAVLYAKIANGEYQWGEENEFVFFNTYRNVTLEEAVAFMVRCLEEDKAVSKNLSETFFIGIEKGLVKESDLFFNKPKCEIGLSEFKILLERFLHMPRGWYNYGDYNNYRYDGSETITYYEYLVDRYTEDFVIKLLTHDGSIDWNPWDRWEYAERRSIQKINENKTEVNDIFVSEGMAIIKLKSYSVIPDILFSEKEVLSLLFEVTNISNEIICFNDNDVQGTLFWAHQNNKPLSHLRQYSGLYMNETKNINPGESIDVLISLSLNNSIDDVTINYRQPANSSYEYEESINSEYTIHLSD